MLAAMSDGPDDARTTPRQIEQRDARTLGITWGDGASSALDVRELRLACGCAHCVDEWTGEQRLDPASVPDDVHPTRIEPVGRYAVRLIFSDGHDTGLYTWETLHDYGERQESLWLRYLERITAQGMSRVESENVMPLSALRPKVP